MLNLLKVLTLFAFAGTVWSAPFSSNIPNGVTTGDLQFHGSIAQSCNLESFVDGTIVASLDQTVMDSALSGGLPAQVNVRTNVDGYSLDLGSAYLIDPKGATMTDVTIVTSSAANGNYLNGTVVPQTGPNAQGNFVLAGGIYNVAVNANATRATGSAFAAGVYTLRIPVSCV